MTPESLRGSQHRQQSDKSPVSCLFSSNPNSGRCQGLRRPPNTIADLPHRLTIQGAALMACTASHQPRGACSTIPSEARRVTERCRRSRQQKPRQEGVEETRGCSYSLGIAVSPFRFKTSWPTVCDQLDKSFLGRYRLRRPDDPRTARQAVHTSYSRVLPISASSGTVSVRESLDVERETTARQRPLSERSLARLEMTGWIRMAALPEQTGRQPQPEALGSRPGSQDLAPRSVDGPRHRSRVPAVRSPGVRRSAPR